MAQRTCARLRTLTRLALLSAGVILALSGTALAQAAGGTLRGKVADPQGQPVPGVTVTATETQTQATRTAVTDASGQYVFSNLKVGLYRVETEITGFKKSSRDAVEVKADSTVDVDVVLDLAAVSEELVVLGVRGALTQAVEVKRESMPIVDALVAEDIGKFPDSNVVESMQRIPGVQVTNRGGGEVSTVSIRGLGDVTTTVNGRNIFTSSGRSVALADIPATLVRQVDVYKTRSPENISRGLAGGIDIHTFRPFDFDGFKFSAQARGIYGEQAGEADPNLSFLISNRWNVGGGQFGALLNASWAQTNWLDQGVHAGASVPFRLPTDPVAPLERLFPPSWPAGTEAGLPFAEGSRLADGTPYVHGRDAMFQPHVRGERERPAVNLSLQWMPNEKSQYTFEAFYNGFRNTQHNSLFFTFVDWWGAVDRNDPVVIHPGTNVVRSRYVNFPYEFISGDVLQQETDSYLYALGGRWDIGKNLKIKSEVAVQNSKFKDQFFALRMDKVSPRLFVDFNTGEGVPQVQFFDDPNTAPNESDLTDASQWNLAQLYDNGQKDKGDAFTWTADADLDVQAGWFKKVKAGVRYDDRGAEENSYLGADLHCNDAPGCRGSSAAAFPGLMGVTDNHFDGQAPVLTSWAIPSQSGLLSNQQAIRSAWGYPQAGAKVFENEFNIDERQIEAYLQADFSTQKDDASSFVDGRIGFRWLNQKTDMSFPDPAGGLATAENGNDVILPSVMLRWGITKDLLARASFAETFNLPTFPQLNPYVQYFADVTNIGYGTASGGNADLKPIESRNYDVSLEWYFAKGSVIHGTWFKRDITNNIVGYRNVVQYNDPDDNPDRGLYSYILSQPDNTGDATLDGWEFGATWFPTLPGLLNGLGIQSSLTVLDSELREPIQDAQGNVTGTDIMDIMGVSKTSFSAMLAYDRKKFNARLAYVWRDDFHDRDEAALFANPLAIWKSAEESLDFQATWHVQKNVAVTFDAVNLTAPVFHENYGDNPKIFNFLNNYYSRTFALGARFNF